jgi:hypothetical protein
MPVLNEPEGPKQTQTNFSEIPCPSVDKQTRRESQTQISDHPCSSVAKQRRGRRGGRRPGAGARPGNLNALKHGRYSRQFATLGAIMSQSPVARIALLEFARQHDIKQQQLEDIAGDYFERLIAHARDIAQGKPSPGPFAGLLDAAKAKKIRPRRRQ